MVLVLSFELVGQDLAVVADHATRHSTVVVLVLQDAAAAGVEPFIADQALIVLVLEVLSVHDTAARGPFSLERRGCDAHRRPSFNRSEAGGPAGTREDPVTLSEG